MDDNANTVYQRVTVVLKVADSLENIYGAQIRKALTVDGLYDDPLAHNHGSNNMTIDRVPNVLFRKGSMHDIVIVGIKDGADYLRKHFLPIGESLHIRDSKGGSIHTKIVSASVRQSVDYISIGGFHQYKTNSPIILTKSDKGKKMFRMLLDSEGNERKKLICKTLGRSIRQQIALLEGVNIADVPRIQVVLKSNKERVIKLKERVSAVTFQGEFSANVLFSAGRYGVGLGRNTSAGFGVISAVK